MKKRYIHSILIFLLMFLVSPRVEAYQSCGELDSGADFVVDALTTSGDFGSWADTGASVPIDLGGYTGDVFVIASIQSSSAANAMTGSWQLTDGSTASTPISRYLSSGSDYGQGTASHIFSGLTGSHAFRLQHRTDTSGRELITTANLVAIPLVTSGGAVLNHDSVSTVTPYSTTNTAYVAVPNTTASLTMPMQGNVYLVASFNSASGNGGLGAWKMEYSSDGGTSWDDVGWSTQRKHGSGSDIGAVSLTALAEDLPVGDYDFRLAVKSDGILVQTTNVTLSAIALAWYDNPTTYGFFSSFTEHVDSVSIGTKDQKETAVSISRTIDTASGGTKVFMGSHYQLGGATTLMGLDTTVDSSPPYASQEILRTISNANDVGNGGAIGLSDTLAAGATYEMTLRFEANKTGATLTNPVLVVVGMSCRTGVPLAVSLSDIGAKTAVKTAVSPLTCSIILLLTLFTFLFLRRRGRIKTQKLPSSL